MTKLELVKITRDEDKVDLLYAFLKNRKNPISHQKLPSYDDHKAFVLSHPYRIWYLVKKDSQYIGTAYILSNNTVGIHLEDGFEFVLPDLLQLIKTKHKPLKAIKSVRAGVFTMNIAPDNTTMLKILDSIGAKQIQSTYII